MNIRSWNNLISLNFRVFSFILKNRWLNKRVFALSYDKLSAEYDSEWRTNIEGMTLDILKQIPEKTYRFILDLGCGTGFSTGYLSEKYKEAKIIGIDTSEGMLSRARASFDFQNVSFVNSDMLEFLSKANANSSDLIFSAWAIGYSNPAKIIEKASKALKHNGIFSFVVNYADTLPEVFDPYRRLMLNRPQDLCLAMKPGFPPDRNFLEKNLSRHNFRIRDFTEGKIKVKVKRDSNGKILPWLLKTGILAGFDRAMSLDLQGPAAIEYEKMLSYVEVIHHHYAGVIAEKK